MSDKPVVWRGVLIAVLFVGAWIWIVSMVRRFDASFGIAPPVWLVPLGWVVAAVGAVVGVSCVALFVTRGRGTPAPFDPPKVFVAVGPYRYVRNPMYVGAIFMLVGIGVILRSVTVTGLGAVVWLLTHLFVLLVEEPDLTRRFGESYLLYKKKVNRWIPWIPDSAENKEKS